MGIREKLVKIAQEKGRAAKLSLLEEIVDDKEFDKLLLSLGPKPVEQDCDCDCSQEC